MWYKTPQQSTSKLNPKTYTKDYIPWPSMFISREWVHSIYEINVILHSNKWENTHDYFNRHRKKHVTTPNIFSKYRTLNKLRIEANFFMHLWKKTIDDVIFNEERMKALPQRLNKGEECPFCHFYLTLSWRSQPGQ
jgi:hypothetical protein